MRDSRNDGKPSGLSLGGVVAMLSLVVAFAVAQFSPIADFWNPAAEDAPIDVGADAGSAL